MPDYYPLANKLSTYANDVAGHLAKTMPIEEAVFRVFEHLTTVLQSGLEDMDAEDMAFCLMKPVTTA